MRGDSAYPVNANGQTYGTVGIVEDPATYVEPDLIACMGTDGTVGYCYKVDLDGEQPSTPEEALEYMARLAENGYTREIPLYESDGETVIGQFVLSPPSTIEG
ncbi:MAG: hypothetical protein LBS51_06795 [Oscillospiraceae bacterium]|nr:hypothetical protein [Oscillospiraceae bacterium]